ncbi:cytochrome P450, partial [Streptomyces sp. SID2955]|nr:cytochrome P450 [Streptomyces sp. SID2955]
GHETTANMIALGVLALLRHPEQAAALRADPGLLPNAVEELLRVFSISDSGTARVAVADLEVGGVTIRAGEGILALNNAADHDESVFPDPGTL